ncbi:MAG: hypothetical protein SGJ18_11420 [Pseudomonadota bacterium]|nr:hypothetical protein [Pseudomonadota bacterium]
MDKAKPKILIIADNVSLLEKACEFLIRRGWQATCIGGLRTGLDFIAKEQPTHVLISVNLPLLSISKFASLGEELKNKYGITLVAFGEKEDAYTMRSVTTCGLKYFVFPPVTGALLHIKLKKLLMLEDDHKKQKDSTFITDRKSNLVSSLDLKSFAESSSAPGKYLPEDIIKNRRIRKSQDARLTTSEIRSRRLPSDIEIVSEPTFRGQCIGFNDENVATIDEVEEIGVMTITSDAMTGYVVLARGSKDTTEMKKLLRNFGDDLIYRLKSRGITLANIHFMSLKVNRVKFEKWTRECAQFCFVSEHMGSETAVAFIPHTDSLPIIEVSKEHPGNLIIRFEDLIANSEIDFDVHIYLEKNARTFIYVKKGSVFTRERLEKVRETKSPLFIENREETDFRAYHASVRLNQSIQFLPS